MSRTPGFGQPPVNEELSDERALDIVAMPVRATGLATYQRLPLSVELSVRLPENSRSRFHVLVSHAAADRRGDWELYTTPRDGLLSVRMSQVEPALLRSFERITDGRWHDILFTCDGRSMALFVDGREVARQSVEVADWDPPNEGVLHVGTEDTARQSEEPAWVRNLRISHAVRAPGTSLSADEETVGLWPLNERSGNTRRDLSSQSNALTYSPGVDPAWTPRTSDRPHAEPWENETDDDWLDGRFNDMDTGRFLGTAMSAAAPGGGPRGFAAKGVAIRVGDRGQASVLFDRGLLQWTAAWTGGFLRIHPRRFGLIQHPDPDGQVMLALPRVPGWDPPTRGGRSVVDHRAWNGRWSPLPAEWGRYLGMHVAGDRTVLSYRIGQRHILETSWAEDLAGETAVTRTLEIQGGSESLRLPLLPSEAGDRLAIDPESRAIVVSREMEPGTSLVLAIRVSGGEPEAAGRVAESGGWLRLAIPPRETASQVELAVWNGPSERAADFLRQYGNAPAHEKPSDIIQRASRRWTAPIHTQGVLGNERPFSLDTLTLPHDNPYGSIFYVTGIGFLPDSGIAISTIYGDVWIVRQVDETLRNLEWTRFASGLYQPMGLVVRDGSIHVLERGQITRLHDRNGDGEADYFENVYNGWQTSGAGHAYDTGLQSAPDGSFFLFKGQGGSDCEESGCLLRVEPDSSGHEVYATGFRHPIGLGVSPSGIVTGADQQGNWIPATRIDRYRQRGFYGDMRTHHREQPPSTYDPPVCWLPQDVDNSAGGQIWVPEDHWGILAGRALHLSWGRSRVFHLFWDEVDGDAQGGVVPLPCPPLSAGTLTGAFRPEDGHLYIVGLHGWQTAGEEDGCLQRIRMTQAPAMPLHAVPGDGVLEIRFSEPLDRDSATDPDNYRIEMWNYRYASTYGSDHWSVRDPQTMGHDLVEVVRADLDAGGRTVRLHAPGLEPAMQWKTEVRVQTATGETIDTAIHQTVRNRVVDP